MNDLISRKALLKEMEKAEAHGLALGDEQSIMAAAAIAGMREYIVQCAPAEQKWIPVTERLPDEQHDWVLAASKLVPEGYYGVPHIAELRNGKWWADSGDFPLIDIGVEVTHWMPLPEPPKEG